MKAPKLVSHSMLVDLYGCLHKYKIKHIDQIETRARSSHLEIGSLVHGVIERFLEAENAQGKLGIEVLYAFLEQDIEALLGETLYHNLYRYNEACVFAVVDTLEYGKKSFGKEYKNPKVTGYYKEHHAYRLGMLHYRLIAPMHRELFITKRLKLERPMDEIYEAARKSLTNFYEMHRGRDGEYSALINEVKYKGYRLEGTGKVEYVSKIDRIEVKADGKATVADYKSGRKFLTLGDVKDNDQLYMYGSAVVQKLNCTVDEIALWDLYNGRIISYRPTDADFSRFNLRIKANIAYKEFVDSLINQGVPALPVPAGMPYRVGCPCDLAYEEDLELKCPHVRDMVAETYGDLS